MTDLFQRSMEIIHDHQSPSGAYPACPTFEMYKYCWFRDGSFIAYAMDLAGQSGSAARFHAWAAKTILNRTDAIGRAIDKARRNEPLTPVDFLHTRYSLNGDDAAHSDWPNFQLDGFGTWLWVLDQHRTYIGHPIPAACSTAADLIAEYLTGLWAKPCYDLWEEYPDRIHTYTLGAIYAGLQAHMRLRHHDHSPTLAGIMEFLETRAVSDGRFSKFAGTDEVDASLIGLATPYQVVPIDDPRMGSTLSRIEDTLMSQGGLHRYPNDSYYGGGEWVILTAWLGWYYARLGQQHRAQAALRWVEAQADSRGQLPEQVPSSLIDPQGFETWSNRWGGIAKPLLWSHAMYIILHQVVSK